MKQNRFYIFELLKGLFEKEFFRFLLVGGFNTVIGYSVTLILFYWLKLDYRLSQITNFVICFPIAYSLQAIYAFRTEWSFKRLLIYPVSSLPNYLLQFIVLLISVEGLNLPVYIAFLVSYIIPIPIMFFVVRFLVKPHKKSKRNANEVPLTKYIILYSLFFSIIFLLGFKDFFIDHGKSFIWYLDGTKQHFSFLYNLAEVLKETIQNYQGIPYWSWQLGLGGDIFHSYSYYVLGDPLSYLVGLLFPLSQIELGYSLMVVLRLFLVGMSLLVYCKYMGLKKIPSVIGSLVYAFSGHILFWGLRHPFFINPAIILPVLLVSTEELFKKKKPYLFILTVAFSAINCFYFFYMNTITVFIYATIRFFFFVETNRKKEFLKIFFKISSYYILGIAIGSVFFVPAAYGFLNTYRVPDEMKLDVSFNLRMFKRFIINDYEKGIPRVSLALISFPCVLLLLSFKDRIYKSFKVLFVIFTIFLCIPFIHSMFNGFSAPNDRWVYNYILIISLLVAFALNNIDKYKHTTISCWILFAFAYFGIFHYDLTLSNFIMVTIGIACFVYGILKYQYSTINNRQKIEINLIEVGLLLLVAVNLITNVNALMSQKNYGSEFRDYNSVLNMYLDHKTAVIKELDDNNFYRVEYDDMSDNRSLVNNFNGTHLYNSIIDKDIIELYRYNQLRTSLGTSAYMGFDEISSLNSLMGVKYYIAKEQDKHIIPYGFRLKDIKEEVIIYENENYLPIGFVYYNWFSKEDISKMDNVDRIYSMLDGAILEEDVEGGIKKPQQYSQKIEYEVLTTDGVRLEENKAIVSKKEGSINLMVNNVSASELFFFIDRIFYENDNSKFKISVETNQTKKSIETRSVNNTYYIDNRDYLYNLGYCELNDMEVKISFSLAGDYKFDELGFYKIDMNDFNEKIATLKNSKLRDIEYSNNFIGGNITLDKPGILFISIPYTPGWKAFVNGEGVETIKVNTAFTGIVLEEGNHEIYLKYTTPLILQCTIISISGIIILIIIIHLDRRRTGFKGKSRLYV
ncbi:YfhO family protein [Alkalibaculum sp. M08DMB]|uniref:YfhO family protein n=1 Tax=Alkalibaculum sporogenes TaxID=2655001 RepID=A0A6A7KB38_9FIRM|nr:GtrA family protein [Alkalibaculum sporogenes]MPW26750.1 YfhO family protein [Alkalibaculum sporogenes]